MNTLRLAAAAVAVTLLIPTTADARHRHRSTHVSGVRVAAEDGVKFIPNPPGTWRVHLSCAHRLAAYWKLGKGLDKVSTWASRFPRVSGPGVGVAAIKRNQHHIMGIIGGSPGAWRVVDFNSGGHLNREYTVADFGGYFFVKPATRLAGSW